VIDPKFPILFNGTKSKWIEEKSEFRQRCPLSPYLFNLCSQLLSNIFNHNGKDLGIKVAASAPKISHLLYADDVLLFS